MSGEQERGGVTMQCQQCKDYQFKKATGSWPSGPAFHRWSLWGCTCDPLDLATKVRNIDYWTG